MHRIRTSRCALRALLSSKQIPQPRLSWRTTSSYTCSPSRSCRNVHLLRSTRSSSWRSFHTNPAEIENDTIYALSTAPGRAAIAIIRISGPACLSIYKQLCPERSIPKPRVATLRKIRSPSDTRQVLDTGALLLYSPAPNTVTGEDILELHVHGGPAIVRGVLNALSQIQRDGQEHIRPAVAGEFTKRAFYNNRIDLTEVEALGEALAAETEQQRRLAVSGAESGLTQRYEEWRSMLLYARGELEALIDFSEDQHFDESPAEFMRSVSEQVLDLQRRIQLHIANANRGELLRNGINVALLGAPNAGKSSLLNQIVGREAAIVSAEEGTTRDIVDVSIDLQGWLVRLGDMAGVRVGLEPQTTGRDHFDTLHKQVSSLVGEIEREGIRRARQRALQADLVIVVVSLQILPHGAVGLSVNDELIDAVNECRNADKNMVLVLNKIDLLHDQTRESRVSLSRLLSQILEVFPHISANEVFCVSCIEADSPKCDEPDAGGLRTFIDGLAGKFSTMTSAATGLTDTDRAVGLTPTEAQSYWNASLNVTHRQSENLKDCFRHLNQFLETSSYEPLATSSSYTTFKHADSEAKPSYRDGERSFFDTEEAVYTNKSRDYHVDNHEDIVGEIDSRVDESNHCMATAPETILETSKLNHALPGSDINTEVDIVTAAEHLRNAADSLAMLTGRGDGVSSGADVEDVLGVVFENRRSVTTVGLATCAQTDSGSEPPESFHQRKNAQLRALMTVP